MSMAALCLGGGLRAKEVIELVAGDVHVDRSGIVVRTAGREVPLLGEWEKTLLPIVEPLAPDALVFPRSSTIRTRNVLSRFVDSTSGSIRPRSDRMRATWVVDHLRERTQIRALMRAAGVSKFENLTHYLQFIPELNTREYRHALRREAR
jgi:integrase